MMALGETIHLQDLPEYLIHPAANAGSASTAPAGSFEEYEKALVMGALSEAGGNQSEAARKLRIGRDAFRYKMKKHGLG